jgi:SAM-dependent methyltransferase
VRPVLRRGGAGGGDGGHIPAEVLQAAASRYGSYSAEALSYGTVRDYCDSFDHLRPLATLNGDLKDLQRPWALKVLLGLARGRRGRLLEIGAGEPVVADLLARLGHEVWIVDPYDGSGNGPTEYRRYAAQYTRLHFIREQFSDQTPGLKAGTFDCVYSISVLEHVPEQGIPGVLAGMKRFLQPGGFSVHAVDHVHRGRGAEEHLANLRLLTEGWGCAEGQLTATLEAATADTDTYFLSAESHNRWRGGVPYDQFPMRVCISIQSCTTAARLRVP